MRRINIPYEVCNIGALAFRGCTSLRCVQFEAALIPKTNEGLYVKDDDEEVDLPRLHIGKYAFENCSSLLLTDIPSHVSLHESSFHCCNILKGYDDDSNSVINRNTNRFKDLPLHRECYSSNVSVDKIKKILYKNLDSIKTLDDYGMTPLHVLVCNPYMTVEMVQCLVSTYPKLSKDIIDAKTTVELFLHCNGSIIFNEEIDTMYCHCEDRKDVNDDRDFSCTCYQCVFEREVGIGSTNFPANLRYDDYNHTYTIRNRSTLHRHCFDDDSNVEGNNLNSEHDANDHESDVSSVEYYEEDPDQVTTSTEVSESSYSDHTSIEVSNVSHLRNLLQVNTNRNYFTSNISCRDDECFCYDCVSKFDHLYNDDSSKEGDEQDHYGDDEESLHNERGEFRRTLNHMLYHGMCWQDIEKIVTIQQTRESLREQSSDGRLVTFMKAAILPQCGLDVVYGLVMKNVESLYKRHP